MAADHCAANGRRPTRLARIVTCASHYWPRVGKTFRLTVTTALKDNRLQRSDKGLTR